MSVSKITLVGNLGRDPDLHETALGTVCEFTLATNEKKRDSSHGHAEPQVLTTWYRVSVWGTQAENCARYLAKGRRAYVDGRLSVEEWKDKVGRDRLTLHVKASDVQFLDGPSAAGEADDEEAQS